MIGNLRSRYLRYIAGNLVVTGKVGQIRLAAEIVPLAGKYAPPSYRLESLAHPTDAGEQIDKRECGFSIAITCMWLPNHASEMLHYGFARNGITALPPIDGALCVTKKIGELRD
jgi:hypothetical protein